MTNTMVWRMRWAGLAICLWSAACSPSAAPLAASRVTIVRVPGQGIQPEVVRDSQGILHMTYLKGEPGQSDVFYVRSSDGGQTFSSPVQVNSLAGSAMAAGTIRGAQLAVGKGGRVHVAWNGSSHAQPRGPLNPEMPADSPHNGLPMLYSRSNEGGTAFEPQRNLMTNTFGLDGGGSVAADQGGNVWVGWHGKEPGAPAGEDGRRVWVARSQDEGKTFDREQPATDEPTGACGCCGMRLFADHSGKLYGLYRSATESVHRDIYLLASEDHGQSFQLQRLDRWEIGACPMSSMAFAENGPHLLGAWETAGQVYFGPVGMRPTGESQPVAAPGEASQRKHPRVAINARGETLLVWNEDAGWNKSGSLAWQLYDEAGRALEVRGQLPAVPTWSFAAVFARPDGGFTIVY